MRIEIKKMVVQAGIGIAQETVVAEGEGLDVIKAYVGEKRALAGCADALLLIKFADGAEVRALASSEDEAEDLKHELLKDARFKEASGIAHFKVVVFDETRNWREDVVTRAGGKIFSTYLFDAGQRTYCCEITPSYDLRHLFSTPLVDDENGTVEEVLREGEAGNDNDGYYHCNAIDRDLGNTLVHDFGVELVDDDGDIAETRESLMEDYREWSQGNCGGLEFPPHNAGLNAA